MQGTPVWTDSTNNSPFTINSGNWIGGTDGARTVSNNPGSPQPELQLNFNFSVVSSPASQVFTLNTTWDNGSGGSSCTYNISITR